MVASKAIFKALAALAIPTLCLSHPGLDIVQHPLESPDCDGSGIVDPDGHCNGDGFLDNPKPGHGDHDRNGFQFENPSTHCEFMPQPNIWDSFKTLEKDMSKLLTLINKDVDFTIVGHHAGAGHYHDRTVAIYGWFLHFAAPLWVCLLLLFLFGFFMTASYSVLNVLIVDSNYGTPATATAANNLVRCFIGAASTAAIIPLLDLVGRGVSFTIVAGVWASITPFYMLVHWRGLQWRQERDAKRSEDDEV